MSTSDLTKATRELFIRTMYNQVYYATPVIEEIKRRNLITDSGGKYYERLVDTAEIDSLMQEYSANDALTDEKLTTLEKPRFTRKYAQLPLRYDVDEYTQNIHAGKEEQLLDLAAHLAQKGQRAAKLWLNKSIFNKASTTAATDSGTAFQSLISALDSDLTPYGTISRNWSAGTNDWWQGADAAALNENVSTTAQDTATNLTISNLRKWINETDVAHHMEQPDDLYIVMCPKLYNKIVAEMEAKVQYRPAKFQRQGVTKCELDGHQIVSSPYLQKSSTTQTWLFILNMRYWELRLHTLRNFTLTPFEWQGKNANGYDYWLARIMIAGNFMCWKPNSSLWLSNVS
jgi:hypothetical protein